uniref:Endonuclease/exonuclease/phosphatase domain-containing protein n=1 Tax=Trichogramma kaykai TaxID=54128 RepID=A0ABD2WJ56_9HYME
MDNTRQAYLSILQWNSRGIRSKVEAVNLFNQYEIIVISETFLKDEDIYQIKGYNIVRFDRNSNRERGGMAILLKSYLKYHTLYLDVNLVQIEIGVINIETSQGPISLITYYRSPTYVAGNTLAEWEKEWRYIVNFTKTFDKFILLGDFNAHHPWWGNSYSCSYGNIIHDSLVFEDNFVLLNDGSPTHFTITNGNYVPSSIDLTFVSANLYFDLCNWKVLDDSWGSDHFPIVTSGKIDINYCKKIDYRYNLSKMSWESFLEELETKKNVFNSLVYLNFSVITKYDTFINIINTCIINSMPQVGQRDVNKIVNGTTKTKCNPKVIPKNVWWNEECDRAVRLRKAKLASLKFRCNLDQFIEYKKTCAVTRRTLKEEKKII